MTETIASSPVYLDSSAVAKLYLPETDSDELEELLEGRTDLLVSDLVVTEIASALARYVREEHLAARDARKVYRALRADVTMGRLGYVVVGPEAHREAERLLMTVGHSLALRAADSLHLATALLAGAQALVTFDRQLAAAARAVGTLEVVPRSGG